jgi:hypothetical protein
VNQDAYFAGDTNSTDLQVNKPLPLTGTVNGAVNNGGYEGWCEIVVDICARP